MLYEEDSQQSYKPTMYIPLKKVKEFSPTNARHPINWKFDDPAPRGIRSIRSSFVKTRKS